MKSTIGCFTVPVVEFLELGDAGVLASNRAFIYFIAIQSSEFGGEIGLCGCSYY